ncbi:MAG: family 16 glycosylhydrolase, partial [Alphaproteobacteria bacterium]|nr:family 16 glycosylhydrolase [Alphaproteobacteria bacterium]
MLDETRLIPTQPAFITLFGANTPERMWYLANHDVPEGFWRNDFRQENISTGANGLSLAITRKAERSARPWNGSEITTHEKYGYGRYEVVMSPARGSGLISSFFTFTGPYFGDQHDEIDIEF